MFKNVGFTRLFIQLEGRAISSSKIVLVLENLEALFRRGNSY
jgi:hypothetical protein